MKAMILAAGLGTRLKPLTDRIPKALVEVEGIPMLERIILNLKRHGFDRIVVNVHHFADQIEDFLESRDFGVKVYVSDEREELLDTGGGIVNAFPILFGEDNAPVLVHNVDILSNADLAALIKDIPESFGGKLLVSKRESSRRLWFDKSLYLKGWENLTTGEYLPKGFVPGEGFRPYAFSGIYSLTEEAVKEMRKLKGKGKYSVMDYFLDTRRELEFFGEDQEGLQVLDIGKPATLSQAPNILKFIDKTR